MYIYIYIYAFDKTYFLQTHKNWVEYDCMNLQWKSARTSFIFQFLIGQLMIEIV